MMHFIHQHSDALVGLVFFISLLNFFCGDVDAEMDYHERNAEEDWMDNPVNPLSQNFKRNDL